MEVSTSQSSTGEQPNKELVQITPLMQKLRVDKQSAFLYRRRRQPDWTDNYTLGRDKVQINRLTQRQSVNVPLIKSTVKTLLKDITLPDTHVIRRIVSSFQSIKGLFVGLGEIQAATAGSTFNAATFTTSLAGVTTAIQTIENNWSATGAFSADKLDTLTRNLATVRGATNRVIKEHLGNSIHTMVVEINKMTHEMETMETGHLQTRLHVLANDLGLGARDEFTIQNRNFTLNVNLDIIVDAEHLQLIMSRTPGAQIMVTLPAGTTVPPVRHP